MSANAFAVRLTDWRRDAAKLRAVREAVFIVEQRLAEDLEWDGDDATSVHVLFPDADMGRVRVLRLSPSPGVGDALMRSLLDVARARGQRRVVLHAQTSACAFYRRLGFVAEGGVYDEAGIRHQTMAREP